MNARDRWHRLQKYAVGVPAVGLRLDVSRMLFDDALFDSAIDTIPPVMEAMRAIEAGALANVDEQRPVGHYWLRTPRLAPTPEIHDDIARTISAVKEFARDVHNGVVHTQREDAFDIVLHLGIGGSSLGPQLLCDALGMRDDPMLFRFIDNTDPDGFDRVLDELEDSFDNALVIVVSKSGGTLETRNAMLETADRFARRGLSFAKHAVAITCEGSRLHRQATDERWLRMFPIWAWVGGRTSITSAVGLLPVALLGVNIDAFLEGAAASDEATRAEDIRRNPAAMLALFWHDAVTRRGKHNMVVLPYCDRLRLISAYLQQLVMESLGKKLDRNGNTVHAGLTVFGNKGSTDQHSYVQQLLEGPDDFFVTFIRVLKDRSASSIKLDHGATAGDALAGFLWGTRAALSERARESITITIDELTPRSLGALIALFERAVGFYAELINVNAYHQPGVESGKRLAGAFIELQAKVLDDLHRGRGSGRTAEEIAAAIGQSERVEEVFTILEHAAANPDHGVTRSPGSGIFDARFAST